MDLPSRMERCHPTAIESTQDPLIKFSVPSLTCKIYFPFTPRRVHPVDRPFISTVMLSETSRRHGVGLLLTVAQQWSECMGIQYLSHLYVPVSVSNSGQFAKVRALPLCASQASTSSPTVAGAGKMTSSDSSYRHLLILLYRHNLIVQPGVSCLRCRRHVCPRSDYRR